MIIFFGDHQPGLPLTARKQIYVKEGLQYIDQFKTKFFIWTNYENTSERDVKISANYLPLLILKQGGFSSCPYIRMLEDVYEKYPIITSQGVIDSEGNYYSDVSDIIEDPLIQMYQYVQYANMFDNIDDAWFEVK